jgi:hypothetical protein
MGLSSQNKKRLSVWVWLDKAFPKKETDNRYFNLFIHFTH